ncbi:MAG: hypothetical protein IPK74_36535 [Deltaproteobacteria bacterium]|nr:hypothetical protein [Deltaproteobacteria bacterium]
MLVTKTVYSLYLPETRAVVDALWAERPHAMYERNYERGQDAMHEPFLAAWQSFVTTGGVRMPSGAGHVVPTAGASEGIFAVMAALATGQLGAMRPVHAPNIHGLDGEYEGLRPCRGGRRHGDRRAPARRRRAARQPARQRRRR